VGPRPDPRGHDDVTVVLMVSDTVAGDVPFGVTPVDENAQVEPAGCPVQERLTCWLKPLIGVTIIV
jgi:hypothetical protein